jgi:hypothetical protein
MTIGVSGIGGGIDRPPEMNSHSSGVNCLIRIFLPCFHGLPSIGSIISSAWAQAEAEGAELPAAEAAEGPVPAEAAGPIHHHY